MKLTMFRFISKSIPIVLPIRVGLGFMYLYSGVSLIQSPGAWAWAVPEWFENLIIPFLPLETYLQLQGAGELFFGAVFLAWFLKPTIVTWVSFFAALEILSILVFGKTGIDLITFRDIGLLGGLITLVLVYSRKS